MKKTDNGINYYVLGDLRTARHVLLMIHGRGASWEQFSRSIPELALDGRAVVVIDLPGHGKSDDPTDWSLGACAEAIHTLMTQTLQIQRFDVFGHSLGGVIALEYIKRYPTHVRKLVVMGTHLEIVSVPWYMIRLDRGIRHLLGNGFLYAWYIALVWCHADPATYAFLKSLWRNAGGHNVKRDMAIIRKIPVYDYRPDLMKFEKAGGSIGMVVCINDWLINPGLKDSLAFMGNEKGRRVEFLSGGHYSHTVDPDPFVKTLQSLLV